MEGYPKWWEGGGGGSCFGDGGVLTPIQTMVSENDLNWK